MIFDPSNAKVQVRAFREGVLSPVGHDIQLGARAFRVEVSEAKDAVSATIEAGSLAVEGAVRPDGGLDPRAFSVPDLRKILHALGEEILEARRFPEISFTSTRVEPQGDGYRVEGTLTLHGVARPLAFLVVREGEALAAEVALDQPAFGIRPFSAMFGALKVKPQVRVRITLGEATKRG